MLEKLSKILIMIFVLQLGQVFVNVHADVERDTPLDQVPPHILDSIARQKPGIKLLGAEEVYRGTLIMYEIEGIYNGKNVEIMINPEGDILKMNVEENDDNGD